MSLHNPNAVLDGFEISPLFERALVLCLWTLGFPGRSIVKHLPAMQETQVWTLGLGRSSGEGNGNPLQYSCPENSMNRRVWWAKVHRVAKSQTILKRLSKHTHLHMNISRLLVFRKLITFSAIMIKGQYIWWLWAWALESNILSSNPRSYSYFWWKPEQVIYPLCLIYNMVTVVVSTTNGPYHNYMR